MLRLESKPLGLRREPSMNASYTISAPLGGCVGLRQKELSLLNTPVVQNAPQNKNIGCRQRTCEKVAAEESQPIVQAA